MIAILGLQQVSCAEAPMDLADRVMGEIGQNDRLETRQMCGHWYSTRTYMLSCRAFDCRRTFLFSFLFFPFHHEKKLDEIPKCCGNS